MNVLFVLRLYQLYIKYILDTIEVRKPRKTLGFPTKDDKNAAIRF